jgi:hypothetical protein
VISNVAPDDSGADIEDQEYVVDAKEDLAASSHNVAS